MGLDNSAGGFVVILVFLSMIVAVVLLIPQGCTAINESAAERKTAGAVAESIRIDARTDSAERLAASRQQERDASHERTIETLPFVALALGGVFVAALISLVAIVLLRTASNPTPQQIPQPPQIMIMMLPGGESRADGWRGLEQLLSRSTPMIDVAPARFIERR